MTDILFGNNNRLVLKLLAKRSLKAQKNTIAVLAIMLATLLFTSLFTIAISLQTAMQESNMRTTGTSAHAGIKRLSWEEYEKLSSDTGIKDIGYSIIIGNAVGDDFNKTPTELRYGDETYSELTFNTPDTGHLPEQKNEIATSRIVLDAMGLPDKVGTQMELTFTTDTDTFTDTFTLCGIWDGDAVAYRQTMLLSKAYAEQVAPVIHGETDGTTPPVGTGYIDAVMMMPTAWNIEKQALEVTSKYGLDERVSINDAYQMATVNLSSMLPLVAGIAVIFIAGYLLIYNVFYISIAQDIRFYGMLKTLGTTARQIRKIVYKKAIKLSLMGIPIGLLLGWPIGRLLLPAIVNMLTDDIRVVTTVNPLIFLVAIVFSAITVFISCQKPAILAAKISPMEALHYIEQTGGKKKQRRSKHISTMMMAKNNLTRNKKKVMIVTLSFVLSIVLLNSVYTYVTSFDFDKFVADFSLTDFTVSDTTVINNYAPYNTANVSQDFISQTESLNGLEDIGNIYLWTSKQPLSENDLARLQELSASSSDIANELENYRVRQEHGVNVYGLDDFPTEYVQVLDGELNTEQWKAGTGVYVTPLRMMGDGSLCLYKPGDQISVTQLDGTNKVYDVLAVVRIPSALQTPLQVDMGLDYIFPTNELLGNMVPADQPAMKTIFNVDHEHQLATENWLKNYTKNTDTSLDYFSKVTLRQNFDRMINMFRLVGGTLCAILALIGILNFINSITTSILSRYREIAMLQSVGMTGWQVKQILIYEGIGYSILGLLGSLILSVIASLTVVRMMGVELTYFTWHFTLLPVFLCIIPLLLITAIVPLVCYNKMAQKTVVERLRIAE
ncbi:MULTISPECIES: ABC transporter permease [unclassified Ruminococcus]|uniref:ABC transporter permease n=1 Tax=unclassified Ruminococcus TaxID=2608920 RepID=UPI0018AA189B|nr:MULTISPECIES: ABC transporter permease [unclassified Ruminococcus]MDB8777675.1 FtsX-like permease family protein [Ruminococcus sp. 1001136sp1]